MAEQNRAASPPAVATPTASPGASPNDAAMARALSQAQAAGVSQSVNTGMQDAGRSDRALTSNSPEHAPQWRGQNENASSPAQEARQAGQGLHDAGATQDAGQAASGQNQLEKSSAQAQNTSRCEAVRDEAKSSAQDAPAQSQSMEK